MNRWDLRLVLRGATCLLSLTTLAGCLQSHEIGAVYDDGVVPVANALECDATTLPYGGGRGTEDDRYRICSGAQLRRIFEEPNAHFVLATDIVLGPHHWSPIEEFSGSIDGAGHVVSELQIYRPQLRTAFVLTLYGSIRNIAFESVLVEGEAASAIVYRAREGAIIEGVRVRGEVTGHGETAGVIGFLELGASATDVAFEGNVTSLGAGEAVGGVFAKIFGTATRIFARATVRSEGSSVGGLVGAIDGGSLTECASHTDTTGLYRVGGVVGIAGIAAVSDCLIEGRVEGVTGVGGIAGELVVDVESARVWASADVKSETEGFALIGRGGLAMRASELFWDESVSGSLHPGLEVGARGMREALRNDPSTFAAWPEFWLQTHGGVPRLSRERETQCEQPVPFTNANSPCEVPM